MAKAHRSPLVGYNHNVSHLGHVFHVQTEDSGPSTPRLFTHLFYGGTILVSRKVEYEAMLPDDQVRTLMQTQHRTVIKDMVAGAFNERIVTFFAARGVSVTVPPPIPQPPPAPSVTTAVATAPIAPAVPPAAPNASTAPPPPASEGVPGHIPRRTTRPIEAQRPRNKSAPPAISVRPPDARRPPFVRNAPPNVAKTASTDGVVIQRSVVIGGPNAGDARARIRPPVPYIVAGGSHQAAPDPGAVAANPADAPLAAKSDPPAQVASPPSTDAAARTPGVFGSGVRDDKSLDEVILEYLAEDGD